MTTLIIDNYDSFTWNLFQLVASLDGAPEVARNDAIDLPAVRALAPKRIILSPGPGHPRDAHRIGITTALLDAPDLRAIPVLGVCLGHQAIVQHFGGSVVRGIPMHGKTSAIDHDGSDLFAGLPRPFEAMRYHSLVADRIPESLRITARDCKTGAVMAVRHEKRPIFGVQFHPESIGTPHGRDLCRAFLRGDFA